MSTPMNPMGLNAQQSAGMISNVSAPTQEVSQTPAENPAEIKMREFLSTFKTAWSEIERLNSENNGDATDFDNMQKAVETWLSNIVTNLSASPQY